MGWQPSFNMSKGWIGNHLLICVSSPYSSKTAMGLQVSFNMLKGWGGSHPLIWVEVQWISFSLFHHILQFPSTITIPLRPIRSPHSSISFYDHHTPSSHSVTTFLHLLLRSPYSFVSLGDHILPSPSASIFLHMLLQVVVHR